METTLLEQGIHLCTPSLHFIFHFIFHLILHYWGIVPLNPKKLGSYLDNGKKGNYYFTIGYILGLYWDNIISCFARGAFSG